MKITKLRRAIVCQDCRNVVPSYTYLYKRGRKRYLCLDCGKKKTQYIFTLVNWEIDGSWRVKKKKNTWIE